MDDFRALGAEVVASSVDSPWALDKFAEATGFNGTLVSDFNHDISKSYGVFNPDARISRRSVFIIDRAGTLRWQWIAEPGQLPDDQELLDVLRKL